MPTTDQATIAPVDDGLTDTALKLSRVIEREAKRRSALRSAHFFRVEQNFPVFRRLSSRLRSSASRSRLSATSVAPSPETPIESLRSGHLPPIPSASPRSSLGGPANNKIESIGESEDGTEPTTWQQRVWQFFDDPQSSPAAYYFSLSLFFFITLSTTVFIAQTEKALDPYRYILDGLETLCAGVFSVEFMLRTISAPSKCEFFKTFGNYIDLAAILPFYLEAVLEIDNAGSFGAIRIVRLTRVARVLKMSRYSSAIQVFVQAIAISMKALSMLLFLMGIAVVVFSSAIYFAEYTQDGCRRGGWMGACTGALDEQLTLVSSLGQAAAAGASTINDATLCVCVDPNPYSSIASSFWWSIVTMSTVGYGDMTPVTLAGRMVGVCTILTGMLVLALPITVIGTNFQKVMKSVMHQTMKSNVDYLKGKKQICREEIQAILQRFHAVTEDIHLDIDDIIQVYDTDSSGTLEDDELARFRHDLEMLQNRAFMNQHMDLPNQATTSVTVASPLARASMAGGTLGTLARKMSARNGSSFFQLPPSNESLTPPASLNGNGGMRNSVVGVASVVPSSSPTPLPPRSPIRTSRSEPNNLVSPTPVAPTVVEPPSPERPPPPQQLQPLPAVIPIAVGVPILAGTPIEAIAHATSPVRRRSFLFASGPNLEELLEDINDDDSSSRSPSPSREDAKSPADTRSPSPSSSPSISSIRASEATSPLPPQQHQHTHHHQFQQPPIHHHPPHHSSHGHRHSHAVNGHHIHGLATPSSSAASPTLSSSEELVLVRLAEVQRAMETRLKETEARIDSKLLQLTKIMLRVEHLIQMEND